MTHKERTGYVPALDGLRGIASMSVVAHHLGQHLNLKHGFHHGYLAVPFFFTLSGYVVSKSYETRLTTKALRLSRFVEIRLIRLMPMIVMATALASLLTGRWQPAILALFIWPTLTPGAILFPDNPPEWSLFYELAGNFIHAILAKVLVPLTLSLGILIAAVGLAVATILKQSVSLGWEANTVWGGAFLFATSYLTGIAIYRLEAKGRLRLPPISFAVIVVLFLMMMAWPSRPGTTAYTVRDYLTALVGFPVVIIAALNAKTSNITERLSNFFGNLSYPLYIIHVPIITFFATLMDRSKASEAQRYLAAPGLFVLCFVCAWLALVFFDQPVRRSISDRLRLRRAQPSAGPA